MGAYSRHYDNKGFVYNWMQNSIFTPRNMITTSYELHIFLFRKKAFLVSTETFLAFHDCSIKTVLGLSLQVF